MSIEWRESFELGSVAAILARYASSNTGSALIVSGRTGAQALRLGSGSFTYQRPTAKAEIVFGFAYLNSSWGAGTDIVTMHDSDVNIQATLRVTSAGVFQLWRGNGGSGTLLASSAAVTAGFYIYIELKYIVSDTVGAYELRINETTMFSGSGADTMNMSQPNIYRISVNGLQLNGGTPTDNIHDDYYVANLSQPIPLSGFYGNQRIEALFPNAFGSATMFTPFGNVSNWQNVDDNPHNSDTDYNYSATVNASDLYGMQNISTPTGTNIGVQLTYVARKDDALARVTAPLIRSGAGTYAGDNDSLTTSYAYYTETWNFNPNTSDYFSISEINALEAGLKVVI